MPYSSLTSIFQFFYDLSLFFNLGQSFSLQLSYVGLKQISAPFMVILFMLPFSQNGKLSKFLTFH